MSSWSLSQRTCVWRASFRTIPFETKRPLIDEVRRVWERLGSVTCYGSLDEFMEERSRRKQRMKTLLKKKRIDDHWSLDDDKEKEKSPSREKKVVNLFISNFLSLLSLISQKIC